MNMLMKRLAGMLLCAAVAFGSVAAPAKEAEMEKKIDALLQKMTLEEKIGQLNQQTGTGYSDAMARWILRLSINCKKRLWKIRVLAYRWYSHAT